MRMNVNLHTSISSNNDNCHIFNKLSVTNVTYETSLEMI